MENPDGSPRYVFVGLCERDRDELVSSSWIIPRLLGLSFAMRIDVDHERALLLSSVTIEVDAQVRGKEPFAVERRFACAL
jgi:hypothetical protein